MTSRAAGVLVAAALGVSSADLAAQPTSRGIDVQHYTARVRPDLDARSVSGTVTIRVRVQGDRVSTLAFDRGALTIDAVSTAGAPVRFETPERRLVVHLASPASRDDVLEVTVSYHGSPPNGLVFAPERRQAYTIFSTRQWLVCVDEPDDKATLDLHLTVPADVVVVASGEPVGSPATTDGATEHHWRVAQRVSTFTMAFAAGRFTEVSTRQGATTLRYLGDGFTAADLGRIFADTADMLAFFEAHAGVPYPAAAYTQVLVANTAGQEAAGFSMLSEAYGRRLLGDASAVTLAAHEFAHQWWGVLVTCRDWRHFWLNEGMATFMAAAYVERRFGRDAYLRQVDGWRATIARVRGEGGDRPLVFPDWNRPTANDRALVYEKGAYLLHLLRDELGDREFWDAMRYFVRVSAGSTVTTRDVQHLFEQSAGRSLATLFGTWAYGPQ